MAQRTLSRTVPTLLPTPVASDGRGLTDGETRDGGASLRELDALLPTPNAWLGRRPENSMADPERAKSREHDGKRGKRSFELPDALAAEVVVPTKLLPTPTAGDGKASGSRNLEGSDAHPGVSLTDAVQSGGSTEPRRLLPSPTTRDHHAQGADHNEESRSSSLSTVVQKKDEVRLLPTPTAEDSERGRAGAGTDRLGAATFDDEVRLLPTPQAADGERTSEQHPRHYETGEDNPTLLGAARRSDVEWGVYEGAVRRWEAVLGRPAPAPTDEKGRLDPPFVEWMLGYPDGHFDVDGVSRTRKLRALGNSVQVQCGEAVGHWLAALLESGLLLEETAA